MANTNKDTSQWILQVWAAFVISVMASTVGVYMLSSLTGWTRAYIILGIFASLSSAFTLSKTLRDNKERQQDTSQWIFQVWVSFAVIMAFTLGGVFFIQADLVYKAYLLTAFLFALSSTFTLAKTIRDNNDTGNSNTKFSGTPNTTTKL